MCFLAGLIHLAKSEVSVEVANDRILSSGYVGSSKHGAAAPSCLAAQMGEHRRLDGSSDDSATHEKAVDVDDFPIDEANQNRNEPVIGQSVGQPQVKG